MGDGRGREMARPLPGLRPGMKPPGTLPGAARLSLRMIVNPSVLRLVRGPLALALALVALRAAAADFTFSSGLSQDQRTECGVSKLTANEVSELDRLVAADVASAHEGGVAGFSSTF